MSEVELQVYRNNNTQVQADPPSPKKRTSFLTNSRLFENQSGSMNLGRAGKVMIGIGVLLILVIIIIFLAISLKRLEAYEVGVGYDTVGRKLGDEVKSEGLYAYVPGTEILRFPNIFKVINFQGLTCLNYDGATITLSVTYQFRARRDRIIGIIRKYRNYENYVKLLRLIGEAELQKACSTYDTFDIIAKRALFAQTAKDKIQARYNESGSDISGLQVDNIARPKSYNNALKEKEGVRENIVVKMNERPKLLTEAEIERQRALADAEIAMETAKADARIRMQEAKAEAEVIRKQFQIEAEIYRKLRDAGFEGNNLLSYIEVDTLSSAKQPVFIGLPPPVNMTSP